MPAKQPATNKPSKVKAPKKPANTNKRKKKPEPEVILDPAEQEPASVIQNLIFLASIAKTSQRQSATNLDNTYAIEFKTTDFNILDLGKVPPLTLVRVTVEIVNERDKVNQEGKVYE